MPLRKLTRIEWVADNAEEPVLDIGCGDSSYFDESVDYTAVDIEKDSDDMVQKRPDNFIQGTATDVPVEDNSFCTILLCEVLEHLDNPIAAIMEADRISYGKILITVPDEQRWEPEANPGQHDDHKREYEGLELHDQIMKAGISKDRIIIDHLNESPFAFWLATISSSKTIDVEI